MTSKELIIRTMEFRNKDQRVPHQMGILPWAEEHYPEMVKKLNQDFDWDIAAPDVIYSKPTATAVGEYVDEWGTDPVKHPDQIPALRIV